METHYYTATSIDGHIADEEDSLDWLFQLSDDPGAAVHTLLDDTLKARGEQK